MGCCWCCWVVVRVRRLPLEPAVCRLLRVVPVVFCRERRAWRDDAVSERERTTGAETAQRRRTRTARQDRSTREPQLKWRNRTPKAVAGPPQCDQPSSGVRACVRAARSILQRRRPDRCFIIYYSVPWPPAGPAAPSSRADRSVTPPSERARRSRVSVDRAGRRDRRGRLKKIHVGPAATWIHVDVHESRITIVSIRTMIHVFTIVVSTKLTGFLRDISISYFVHRTSQKVP